MFRKRKKAETVSDKLVKENKKLKEDLKKTLESCIMSLNEVQDIQAIKISEEEKDKMRNSIINTKRTKFVTKIIELESLTNHSNSQELYATSINSLY